MNSNLRILMFAPGFAPYSFSENIVNSKLALAFHEHGWEIDIISMIDAGPLYSTDWHEPWLPLKKSTYTLEYPHGNMLTRSIDLLRQVARMRFPIGGLRWSGRALDQAMELHRKNPYQLVISRAPTDIGHVPALFFSKRTKVPWIANWNDPPSHLWPPPYKNVEGILQQSASRRLMASVFKYASVVTFPSERLRNHILRSIERIDTHHTQIVPHIGLPGYEASERIPDGCFRVCHAGNLSRERNPKTFLDGVSLFIEHASMNHPFEICILGASDHQLASLAESYKLTHNIKISGGLNYLDTFAVLEQSDVLAVVEAPCENGIFLPSKVADYAQVGRPLLAVSPDNGTIADLIRTTRAGEFAACGKPEAIADALMALYKSWCDGRLNEDYSSKMLWEHFRPENVIMQYEKMFSRLIL